MMEMPLFLFPNFPKAVFLFWINEQFNRANWRNDLCGSKSKELHACMHASIHTQ